MKYDKALVEVYEVLKHLSHDNYKKIPKNVIEIIKENKNKNYTWKYDETKELKEQSISTEAIALLSYINMEFLLTKEQKEIMNDFHDFFEKNAYNT